jgi:hypothetical protein
MSGKDVLNRVCLSVDPVLGGVVREVLIEEDSAEVHACRILLVSIVDAFSNRSGVVFFST